MKQPSTYYRVLCWLACILCTVAMAACFVLNRQLSYTRRLLVAAQHESRLPNPHAAAKYRDRQFEFVVRNYGFEYEGTTGDVIDDVVLFCGAWEKHIAFFMRDYLQRRNNQQARFIDVGCNAGHHSLFLSQYVKHIDAFDPYLPAVERFRKMIERNGFTNITVHPVGLGVADETLPYFEPSEDNFGNGTFRNLSGEQRTTEAKLRIVRGDSWLAPFQLSALELVKIDIEGFEQFALAGLRQTLEEHRPVVVLEVSTPPRGTIGSLPDLQKLFPRDYRFLIFLTNDTTGLEGRYELVDFEPNASTFFSKGFQANLVAYPTEKQQLIPRSRLNTAASLFPLKANSPS